MRKRLAEMHGDTVECPAPIGLTSWHRQGPATPTSRASQLVETAGGGGRRCVVEGNDALALLLLRKQRSAP